jgi:hypothetical protein
VSIFVIVNSEPRYIRPEAAAAFGVTNGARIDGDTWRKMTAEAARLDREDHARKRGERDFA